MRRVLGGALPIVLSGFLTPAGALPPFRAPEPSTDLDRDTRVDANRIDMFVTNHGSFAYDIPSGQSGLTFPAGTDLTAMFAGGLWMGATVAGGTRVAIAEYSWEYAPGQILTPTSWSDPFDPVYHVYKIQPGDTPASNPDYADWPVDQGAPVDANGDPRHFGGQTLWCVYHDLDPSWHTNDAGHTAPLGIEVQQTCFATGAAGASDYLVFLEWKIVNKGSNLLQNAYVGIWADPDLGTSTDDLVGCDPEASLGYCYQGSAADGDYGVSPPAVGIDLVQGPIVPSPGDQAYVSGVTIPDYKNLPMTAFLKYINGTDPASASDTYHYLRGLERDGSPIIDPTTGLPTTYMVSGDPVTGSGWIDTNPADRRLLVSAGPFTMAPGDVQTIAAAVVVGQGNDRLSSVTVLRDNAAEAAALFRSAYGDETGACCQDGQACRIATLPECTDGVFRVGETCSPDPCGTPQGACCFDNGTCLPMFSEDCAGRYQGDGTTCAPGLCEEYGPPSACCLDGDCEQLAEFDCLAAGGTYYAEALCPLLSPGAPPGWQRNDRPAPMIDEVATGGGMPVTPDSHGGPGNDLWHSYNSTGEWILSAGGGDGGEGRFTRDGADEENLTEDDVILKWDGDSDNYGWWAFDNGVAAPVPFGLYERNPATGEETRLIPVLFSNDHTEGVFDISSSTPDVFSDFPATDWVYAYRFDPSIATYEEWVQDARDGQIHTDPTTDELFARLIFASDTERLPATGTVIQFSTNKSGIVAGSGFEGAVPIAWERPESAPCFTPEYDVFRDGRQIATTARLDYLDGAIPVDDEPYAYQIRARHPVTGETSELTAVKIAEPHAGGFAATSGLCVVPPTIDGSIGAQEWAAATVIEAGPYPGSPAARLLVMNNRTFLYLALDDAASAEAVEIYLDANGDGHYGTDALEGRIVLDHGALRFVRLIGEYPDVSEIETIENPVWLAAAATGGSAEIRLTLTVGPLRDRPATDTVSLFARAPEGVAAYPPGPVVVLSQAPRLFAKIQLADASALPGFSELPHPTPVIGQDLSFAVALDVVPEARVSCLYRSPQSVAGLHEVAVAHPETAIELRPNERGAYQVTIPAAAITPSGISYRIQVVEPDGRVRRSDPVLLTTATLAIAASSENEDLALLFADLSTSTSFPNPFQGTTTIAFRVPVEQSVSAGIYDVGGKRVRELRRNETLTAGVHTVVWDGRNDAGRAVATGIYYYRITGGDFRYTRPISFLR